MVYLRFALMVQCIKVLCGTYTKVCGVFLVTFALVLFHLNISKVVFRVYWCFMGQYESVNGNIGMHSFMDRSLWHSCLPT